MLKATGWWLTVIPMDLRYGIDRLLMMVCEELGQGPRDGGAYIFRNHAGTRIKVICVDAQGVWLNTRRLHEDRFHWPRAGDAARSLAADMFSEQVVITHHSDGTLVAYMDARQTIRDTYKPAPLLDRPHAESCIFAELGSEETVEKRSGI
jgi:transposase